MPLPMCYVSLLLSLMSHIPCSESHVLLPMAPCYIPHGMLYIMVYMVYVVCLTCDLSVSTEAAAVSLPGPAPWWTHWGTGATPLRPGRPAPASHLHWGPPDQNIKHQQISQSTCLDDKVTSKLYVGPECPKLSVVTQLLNATGFVGVAKSQFQVKTRILEVLVR